MNTNADDRTTQVILTFVGLSLVALGIYALSGNHIELYDPKWGMPIGAWMFLKGTGLWSIIRRK